MILRPAEKPQVKFGLVEMTNEAYHASEGVSKSRLDVMAHSAQHYWQAYINPAREPREATPAMFIGTLIHSAILEPDLLTKQYVVLPENAPNRPTKAQLNAQRPSAEAVQSIAWWKWFEAEHAGRVILTPEQWALARGARDSVHQHPRARQLLARGKAEQSYFALDPDSGAIVKCRTDWTAATGEMVDVKSTVSAAPDQFQRSVLDYRYHVQQPWYQDVVEAATDAPLPSRAWYFLAVEKTPPYACALYTLPEDVVRAGRLQGQRDLRRIVECTALDEWPGYSTEPVELQFSKYARDKMGANSPEADFA